MRVLGIDSDAKGSAALLDSAAMTLDVWALPNRYKELGTGKRRIELDFPVLVATMIDLTCSVDVVVIEEQWSRPSQDIGAMFGFGQTQGDIRAAVAAGMLRAGVPLREIRGRISYVPGARWKPAMRLDNDKTKALALADLCFPDCKHAWKLRSKHTSAAEASLLALYELSQQGVRLQRGVRWKPADVHATELVPSLVSPKGVRLDG